ncbi:hypothetical protein B0H10DRAFT_1992175 [Mycena sp. CBHHK59/15]|nr:hypothetical protein B0H10DRAFT_1992175 [Mycena sp. CBHHK59/15]
MPPFWTSSTDTSSLHQASSHRHTQSGRTAVPKVAYVSSMTCEPVLLAARGSSTHPATGSSTPYDFNDFS